MKFIRVMFYRTTPTVALVTTLDIPVSAGSTAFLVRRLSLLPRAFQGAECPFSHDAPQARKRDMCKFYLSGYCARGEHCSFMHQEFPCKFFHTGAKCFADASCRFSHQPLTEETQRLLGRVSWAFPSSCRANVRAPKSSKNS